MIYVWRDVVPYWLVDRWLGLEETALTIFRISAVLEDTASET